MKISIMMMMMMKMITINNHQAVQNVRGEGGAIKYSDFRDLVINLRIERK